MPYWNTFLLIVSLKNKHSLPAQLGLKEAICKVGVIGLAWDLKSNYFFLKAPNKQKNPKTHLRLTLEKGSYMKKKKETGNHWFKVK